MKLKRGFLLEFVSAICHFELLWAKKKITFAFCAWPKTCKGMFSLIFCHGGMDHRDSDNYFWQICALGQWQSRRKNQKGNIELNTAFFQKHNFVWSLPRNIGHRPSKCQELNKFYIVTYRCYWFLLFMLFSNISWPDLTKRTRSLTWSQHDSRKISELFHIIIRWVTVCTKWQFRT